MNITFRKFILYNSLFLLFKYISTVQTLCYVMFIRALPSVLFILLILLNITFIGLDFTLILIIIS